MARDAALEHGDPARRDGAEPPERRRDLHDQRLEVPRVDPDDLGVGRERPLQVAVRVRLQERLHPEGASARDHPIEQLVVEAGRDQQDRIRPGGARLDQLVGVDQEVLPEHRDARDGSHETQIDDRPPEVPWLGQDRDRGRAPRLVRTCEPRRVGVGVDRAGARGCALHLGDHGGDRSAAKRVGEGAGRRGGPGGRGQFLELERALVQLAADRSGQIGEEPHGAGKSTGAVQASAQASASPRSIRPSSAARPTTAPAAPAARSARRSLDRPDPACRERRPTRPSDPANEVDIRSGEASDPIDRGHEECRGTGRMEPAEGAHQIEAVRVVRAAGPPRSDPAPIDLDPDHDAPDRHRGAPRACRDRRPTRTIPGRTGRRRRRGRNGRAQRRRSHRSPAGSRPEPRLGTGRRRDRGSRRTRDRDPPGEAPGRLPPRRHVRPRPDHRRTRRPP